MNSMMSPQQKSKYSPINVKNAASAVGGIQQEPEPENNKIVVIQEIKIEINQPNFVI